MSEALAESPYRWPMAAGYYPDGRYPVVVCPYCQAYIVAPSTAPTMSELLALCRWHLIDGHHPQPLLRPIPITN